MKVFRPLIAPAGRRRVARSEPQDTGMSATNAPGRGDVLCPKMAHFSRVPMS
jgi:hypothetical protein